MKKKWLMALLCALALALTACAGAPNETTSVPVETMQPSVITTQAPTEPALPPDETNVLRQFVLPENTSGDGEYSDQVYDTPYLREQISSITILDTLADAPEEVWDASEAQNGAVLCWVQPNGELYDLYIGAEGGVWAGQSARNMFRGYTNAERIDFNNAFHTEQTLDMYGMFYSCDTLQALDLSCFDTSQVRTMESMFSGCDALETVDLSSFDTAHVERMDHMFDWCLSLEELELLHFDTANVDNMASMFANCASLTRLDLCNFETTRVTQMNGMFDGCRSLTELDVSGFDTSGVQDMGYLFRDCVSLEELDLSHFDMSSIQYPTYKMFVNCPAGDDWKHLTR